MTAMKTIASTSLQRGVILPIVLVVMMVVTTLVITQVRRATVDERLAGNWSRLVSGETAAESMLRLCEHVVINVERDRWDSKYQSTDFVNYSGMADTDRPARPDQDQDSHAGHPASGSHRRALHHRKRHERAAGDREPGQRL